MPMKVEIKINPSNNAFTDWMDKFDTLCPIGKGSFGEVWKVKHKSDVQKDESDSKENRGSIARHIIFFWSWVQTVYRIFLLLNHNYLVDNRKNP
ncbi:unnamed protein product [Oppiella nova]|uniref:Protein kinase domain-containing protein n=1 Tax=Oppiella nova TaxID=334625 RepID=A0A7R9QXD0_9ACAR|nr:unnamed protein product [Oppiella nova]CAG2179107.1 unnamed protein product [Oppiella nova]